MTRYLDDVTAALGAAGDRFATLVSAAPDPGLRVSHSPQWTVAEVVRHVATVVPRYAQGPEGRGRWVADRTGLAELNTVQITTLDNCPVPELAQRISTELREVCTQIGDYRERIPSFRFHGGSEVRADEALGILLAEVLVHGRDVACALGQPWPIEPRHVALSMVGLTAVAPGWVDPQRARGLTVTVELRLRRHARYVLCFADGRLRVDPPDPGRIDVHLSADPEAFLLVLYRREPQWRYIATGRLLAWGRRPWHALSLADCFYRP